MIVCNWGHGEFVGFLDLDPVQTFISAGCKITNYIGRYEDLLHVDYIKEFLVPNFMNDYSVRVECYGGVRQWSMSLAFI